MENEDLVRPIAQLVGRMGVCVLYRVRVTLEDLEKLQRGHYEPVVWFWTPDAADLGGAWIDTTEPERFGAKRSHPAEPETPVVTSKKAGFASVL